MRIFVPFEINDLCSTQISPRLVHGVTKKLVRAFPNADQEELEYVATMAAADDSLRLLDSSGVRGFRRIVGVVEAPNSLLALPSAGDDVLETGIFLEMPLEIAKFESFLVDEPGNEALVRQAIFGDESAFLQTGDIELLWYDAIERSDLFQELQ